MARAFLPFDCITLTVALNGLMANASTFYGRWQSTRMGEEKKRNYMYVIGGLCETGVCLVPENFFNNG